MLARQRSVAISKFRTKRCILILVLICVGILIWASQLIPPLAGLRGILTSVIKVLEPEIDYSSRNVTGKLVRNRICIEKNITYNTSDLSKTCPLSYVFNGSMCVPECLVWNPGGPVGFWSYRVSTLLGVSIQLVSCSIFLFVWLKANRNVWRFPTILSFYLMLTLLVQSLAVLAGAVFPKEFYCSSKYLSEARMKSTISCQVQGAIFHYSLLAFMLWYLASFINLTILLCFPLRGSSFLSNRRYLHVFESILCWGLPVLIVLGTFFGDSSGNGYKLLNAPEFCLPSDKFLIATLYFPGILFTIILGTLSVIIIYNLVAARYFTSISQSSNSTSTVSELFFQVLVFLICFGVMICIVILDLIVYINLEMGYLGLLDEYLLCLHDFNNNASCCNTTYKSFYIPALSVIAGFFTTVYGAPALLAIIGRLVREQLHCKRLFRQRNRRPSQKLSLTTSFEISTPRDRTTKSSQYAKAKKSNTILSDLSLNEN